MAVTNNIAIMINASLIIVTFLNKNIEPSPQLHINPARHAPNEIPLIIYNSVIIIEEAQFGINPTKLDNNGDKYLLACKKLIIFSSPK